MAERDDVIPPPSSIEIQAAREKRLGALVETLNANLWISKPKTEGRRLPAGLVWVGLLLAFGLPLITMVVVKVLTGSDIAFLLGILVLVGEAAALWILARRPPRAGESRGKVVHLFELGFVCAGDQPKAYRWSEVPTIYIAKTRVHMSGAYAYTNFSSRMVTTDGREVALAGVDSEGSAPAKTDIARLTQVAANEVYRRQLPVATAEVDAWGVVEFGDISVTRDGIHAVSGKILWPQITEVKVSDGKLTIRVPGQKRFTCEADEIPNFAVFMALVDRFAPTRSTTW